MVITFVNYIRSCRRSFYSHQNEMIDFYKTYDRGVDSESKMAVNEALEERLRRKAIILSQISFIVNVVRDFLHVEN